MIEEKLESLIERYTIEIEDEIKNLKKYKDELENNRIWSLQKIVERMASEIFLKKEFLLDLKYMKGEN